MTENTAPETDALRDAELSMTLEGGRVLTAPNLLSLAGKWAEAEHGDEWPTLSAAKQSVEISHALSALTEALGEAA